MKTSARSAALYENTLGRSIVALQKLSLQHDQEIRELAGALTNLWLAPKSLKEVKAGLEAGADYMRKSRNEEEGTRWERRTRTWQRHSWKHSRPRRRTTQTSADVLHGARGSAAGNSDRVLSSVQGEGGLINGGNPQQRSARQR